ncbi:MAG: hypothetical protein ABH880_01500 [Patescibacteria group bacterium]
MSEEPHLRKIKDSLKKLDPHLKNEELEKRALFLVDNSKFLIRLWLEHHEKPQKLGGSTEFIQKTEKAP